MNCILYNINERGYIMNENNLKEIKIDTNVLKGFKNIDSEFLRILIQLDVLKDMYEHNDMNQKEYIESINESIKVLMSHTNSIDDDLFTYINENDL